MTENERVLRDIIIDGNGFDYDESIPQSIFEEIQQYRAIGTVEECEKAMDFELAKQDKMLAEVIDDYLKYIKIGTIEEFKDLKEKSEQIPIIHGKAELELHDKGIRNKVIDEVIMQLEAEVESSAKFIREYDDSIAQKAYYKGLSNALKIAEEMKK